MIQHCDSDKGKFRFLSLIGNTSRHIKDSIARVISLNVWQHDPTITFWPQEEKKLSNCFLFD